MKAQIAGIPDGGGNAFIAVDTDNEQAGNIHVAQYIGDVGGDEDAAGGFIDDDFIAERGDLLQKLRFFWTRRGMQL